MSTDLDQLDASTRAIDRLRAELNRMRDQRDESLHCLEGLALNLHVWDEPELRAQVKLAIAWLQGMVRHQKEAQP